MAFEDIRVHVRLKLFALWSSVMVCVDLAQGGKQPVAISNTQLDWLDNCGPILLAMR